MRAGSIPAQRTSANVRTLCSDFCFKGGKTDEIFQFTLYTIDIIGNLRRR